VTRAADGATTHFGYAPGKYDIVKNVGSRHTAAFPVTTYFEYDGDRNLTAAIDPLGNARRLGYDSLGRRLRRQDRLGNTTYFNYGSSFGTLDTTVDPEGSVSYFGYDTFANLKRQVSPRWTEKASFAAFTSYFEYDTLDRRTKAIDPAGSVAYFDWTSRGDILATVDPLGREAELTYNAFRQMTRRAVLDSGGALLTHAYYEYL
jgi:YD repeat-containing protein